MSYEPTEWKSGDVISSAKLNKIEQGIAAGGTGGGGVFVVGSTMEGSTITLDKTWKEIADAMTMGMVIIADDVTVQGQRFVSTMFVTVAIDTRNETDPARYMLNVFGLEAAGNDKYVFRTGSENGYPTCTMGG